MCRFSLVSFALTVFLGLGASYAQAQAQTKQAPLAAGEPKAEAGENSQEEASGQLKLSTQTFTQTFHLGNDFLEEINASLPKQPEKKTGRLLNLEVEGDHLFNPQNTPWSQVDGLPLQKSKEKKLLRAEWVDVPWAPAPVFFPPLPSHVNAWPHVSRSRFHAYDNVLMRGNAEFALAAGVISALYQLVAPK